MGPGDLEQVFARVNLDTPSENVLVGTQTLDDAGVYQISPDTALIQSVDYFTPIVDDPYLFGQIAAANALSDIYAMGGTPITVLNIVGYPIAKLGPEIMARILEGGAAKVKEAGAALLGGHSIDDTDPKFGMAVTGTCHPEKIWRNSGARPGDVLVLTKPLGAGVMTTAIKRGLTTPADEDEIVAVMSQLNKTAAEVGRKYTVNACTDVTGFGFLGHSWEMAEASNVELHVDSKAVPILPRAFKFATDGVVPSGSKRNRQHVEPHITFASGVREEHRALLCDAITSGGLLFSVPAEEASTLVSELQKEGLTDAAAVATVHSGTPHIVVEA
nr:selenide, water dikinase SelD [Alicyclobacillus sp. SO9]